MELRSFQKKVFLPKKKFQDKLKKKTHYLKQKAIISVLFSTNFTIFFFY